MGAGRPVDAPELDAGRMAHGRHPSHSISGASSRLCQVETNILISGSAWLRTLVLAEGYLSCPTGGFRHRNPTASETMARKLLGTCGRRTSTTGRTWR